MPFIDIAFQAEISRYEDADFEEYARRNCGENPETRAKAIEELRRMIYDREECSPRRLDDAYLLRFLRCRRFIPALAHRLIVRYEEFRERNAHLYRGVDAFGLKRVRHVYAEAFPEGPDSGRLTLMRFGRWESDIIHVDDVVRCALIMDEIAALQPKIQILGVTVIVDLENLSLRQVSQLTPSVAGQIVALMGTSFPVLLHGIHIVNYSWILHTCFFVFKQFIPAAAWNRIHFHGRDMASLQKHIQPQYLPREYGGTCRHVVAIEDWLEKINKYKDEFLVNELRDLGFVVKD